MKLLKVGKHASPAEVLSLGPLAPSIFKVYIDYILNFVGGGQVI